MSVYTDFTKFVTDMEASSTYSSWCSHHAADCALWQTYRTALLTDPLPPPPPSMGTRFGSALVDVGIMAVDAGLVPPLIGSSLQAGFTYSVVSAETIAFTDTSTPGASGPIIGWAWTFGDGGTSTAQNPTHVYAAPGSYSAKLVVTGTSPDGTDTYTTTVVVPAPAAPVAAFSASISGLTAAFTDQSLPGSSGPITARHWDFGDGNTSSLTNPSHTYAVRGTYTVTLTVTGTAPDGTDSISHTYSVVAASGSVLFDGRASRFSIFTSHEVLASQPHTIGPVTWTLPPYGTHYFYTNQTPAIFNGCLCFIKDDISLLANPRYGKEFKVAVTTGDTNQWHGSTGGTVNGAGEVSQRRTVALETWNWYAVSIRIDSWNLSPTDLRFCEMLSLGYQTSSNSQVAFDVVAGPDGALWYAMNANAGHADGVQGAASGTTHFMIPFMPVAFGRQEEFVVGVKWSTHTTGEIQVHNRHVIGGVPGAWAQVFDRANIDTELWGPIYDGKGNLIRNFAQDASNWPEVIDKLGLYFAHSSRTVTTETVYNGGFVNCSDLATAKSVFPA